MDRQLGSLMSSKPAGVVRKASWWDVVCRILPRFGLAIVVLSIVLCVRWMSAPVMAQNSGTVVFERARVIKGDGSPAIESGEIVVRNGKIMQVGSEGSVKIPKGATRVDLSGKTVMPMMFDAHGHIGYMKGNVISKENYNRENILDQLRRLEYYGVEAIQSMGTGREDLELTIRNEQRSGKLSDPELAMLFTANDGIVPYNSGKPNGGPNFAVDVVHEAATPDQAREFVRFEAAKKVDIIKFWDDDRNHTKPKMPPDIYKAIIDEAHKQNVPVIAHIFELQEAKGVAAAGINGIAHPVRDKPVDDEFVKLMKDHDVFQCSNLSPMAPRTWLDDPALAETEPQSVTAQFKGSNAGGGGGNNVFSLAQHNEKVENDAGIRILLCGDTAGVPAQYPGYSEHRELQALVGAGISPIQVIHDATEVSAKALGLNDTGVLTPGKRADFLVLSGNPLDDMSNTLKIASIYRDGRSIDRNALRAKITAAMGQ